MAMKPILFNTEMVKAILDGRKTQTRRLCKGQPQDGVTSPEAMGYRAPYEPGDVLWVRETWRHAEGKMHLYEFGEIVATYDGHKGFEYRAGGYYFPDGFTESDDEFHLSEILSGGNWRPSIHMPREAARLFLRVKDVRMERLQDMTEDDALAEGYDGWPWCYHKVFENYPDSPIPCVASDGRDCPVDRPCDHSIPELFGREIWEKTIKPADLPRYGWEANPWVWVIEFERVEAML